MIIPKEEYGVAEDIVTVIYEFFDSKPVVNKFYQTEYDECLTLYDFQSAEDTFENLTSITVIAENPFSGTVMRYDKLSGNWKNIGTLRGYA